MADYTIEVRKYPVITTWFGDRYHLQLVLRDDQGQVIDQINGLATNDSGNVIPMGDWFGFSGDDSIKVYHTSDEFLPDWLSTEKTGLELKDGPIEIFSLPEAEAIDRWYAGIYAGEQINILNETYAAVPWLTGYNSNSAARTIMRVMGLPYDDDFTNNNTPGSTLDMLPNIETEFDFPPLIYISDPTIHASLSGEDGYDPFASRHEQATAFLNSAIQNLGYGSQAFITNVLTTLNQNEFNASTIPIAFSAFGSGIPSSVSVSSSGHITFSGNSVTSNPVSVIFNNDSGSLVDVDVPKDVEIAFNGSKAAGAVFSSDGTYSFDLSDVSFIGLVNSELGNLQQLYKAIADGMNADFATSEIPNAEVVYRSNIAKIGEAFSFVMDSLLTGSSSEFDRYFYSFGLMAQITADAAGLANGLSEGIGTYVDLLGKHIDPSLPLLSTVVSTFKEGLAGYKLLVGEDIAMAALVEGGVNADSLAGTSANNLIYGYGSSDFVDGNSGNDVIFGGAGNDTLLGDLGVDTVYGGDGDDELWAGGDEVAAGEILDGGAGSNTLVVWDAKLQNATLSNLQTMWINDYVTLTAAQFAQFSSVNGDATIIAASAGTYDISEKTVWYGVLNLQGSSGDDYLAGDGEGQTITGGAGNDALQGNGGADTLLGGDGDDDFLTGFSESPTGEVMNGGTGSNRISSWNADLSAATISNIQTLGAHLDYVTLTAAQLGVFNTLIAYGSSPITLNAASAGSYSLAGKTLTGTFNLNGSMGNDTLAGGTGVQTLSGGTGNDTYLQVRGGGADTVVENDATSGNTDVLQFASDVARDQLWFTQSGNDLLVQIIGTTDSVTVKDWYLGSANHAEQIKAAGGGNTLLDSQVQNLVNAMAGLAVPTTTTLSPSYHAQLDTVIAANWT